MLGVSNKFPLFKLTATVSNDQKDAFKEITNDTYKDKWLVVFFYPKAFTFVCPTEIVGFDKLNDEFVAKDAQVLSVSTDNEFVHLAWRNNHPDLKNLKIPLVSDIKRELSLALGVLDHNLGVANRATFIVDPKGYIRYSEMTDLSVGRNPNETMRILDALKEGGLCPCSWKKGDDTL
ncbi:peroxiredoxin [Rickettsiales bacterium LUAb2]